MHVPAAFYVMLGATLTIGATSPATASAQVPTVERQPRVAVPARGAVIETAAPAPAAQPPGQPTTATAPAEPAPVTAVTGGPAGVTPVGAAPATASSSQAAMAGPNRSYAAGKFGLTLEGVQIGWPRSVEGGSATAEVVVEKGGSDHIPGKHIAGVRYEMISVVTDLQSKALTDWIAASWKGSGARKSGSILNADHNYSVVSELEFANALVAETTMPALDAGSKDAAGITVKLAPEYTRLKPGSGAKAQASDAKSLKKWSPAYFRFEMAGLDGSKVSKIDSFTVRQAAADNPVGELRVSEKAPGTIEFPNLKITLAAQSAQTWADWHDDFVIKGNNGDGQEKNGAIVFLDHTMKDELGRINLLSCGIFRFGAVPSQTNADAVGRVSADLYCERMELVAKN